MGQSREQKELYRQMTALIAQMQKPQSNPAQEWLTNQALSAANTLSTGEYSKQLPKGMFFDFQMPSERNAQYKKLANVNQGGTFALANQGGAGARSQAQALQGKYLADRFARDSSQQYQNDITNAWQNVRQGLGQASGYQTNQQQAVLGALGNLYSSMPQKQSPWGSILGLAGGALSLI